MSGTISGTRNKTGVTVSILPSQYDVTTLDWAEILTAGSMTSPVV
ncbi:MAG: hypothetical protein ACFFFC_17230 [Candidatus Thorarchaeota archaeon]